MDATDEGIPGSRITLGAHPVRINPNSILINRIGSKTSFLTYTFFTFPPEPMAQVIFLSITKIDLSNNLSISNLAKPGFTPLSWYKFVK
jgi:hypothetical protein